ncbi:MAG: MBL fold metallo-hydrolase [Myxococcota bacterium]|nr:MBL fold metallo-hydrolase [Myxococcota bacterium]
MRFLSRAIGMLLAAVVTLAAGVLTWSHLQIRRIAPPLPSDEEILEADREADLPVRLSWINTASQRMPRSGVLEPDLDPSPNAEYTMSHPAFVVEWQDGRVFLIDLGMDPAAAVEFGLPSEIVVGADPIEPHGSVSSRLGDNRSRVAGIGFTHMHTDHTTGLIDLCRDLGTLSPARSPVRVFQHRNQITHVNHTTRGAKAQLQSAECVEPHDLGAGVGRLAIPGFPGVFAIPVGGHTPGSTIYVVQLQIRPGESEGRYDDIKTWVITGDVVNHQQGVELDLPKPRIYSLLVVPENDEQLGKVRRFLAGLARQPGVEVLVTHDRNQIEGTRLPSYRAHRSKIASRPDDWAPRRGILRDR